MDPERELGCDGDSLTLDGDSVILIVSLPFKRLSKSSALTIEELVKGVLFRGLCEVSSTSDTRDPFRSTAMRRRLSLSWREVWRIFGDPRAMSGILGDPRARARSSVTRAAGALVFLTNVPRSPTAAPATAPYFEDSVGRSVPSSEALRGLTGLFSARS